MKLIVCFISALVFSLNGSAQERQELVLSDFAVATGEKVKLGDLLASKPFESQLWEQIIALVPADSKKIVLTNVAVSQAISSYSSKLSDGTEKTTLTALKITIPRVVSIMTEGWEASTERARRVLQKTFNQLCGLDCEVKITAITYPHRKTNYTDKTSFNLKEIQQLPKGSFNYEVSIATANPNAPELGWVTGTVQVLKKVPVAKRLLYQGWRVNDSDFEIRMHDVTHMTDVPASLEQLRNSKIVRTIIPFQPILASYLAREQDVSFGQPVKLVVGGGNWKISMDAVARDSGSIGDRIKVFNPQSKKLTSGILIEKGVVELR